MRQSGLKERLNHVFVPMFTPFNSARDGLNEAQLRINARYLIERGIRILNPAGTTGEFWTLTPDEHRRVLQCVLQEAKAVDPTVVVVAGISTPNLTMTLDLARFAADSGADLLQLMPTYCLPMVADDVVSYYEIVSNAIPVPVMVYEMPSASGVEFNCGLLQRICDACPNVVALKTASPLTAPWEFERIVDRFSERLSIFAATGAYFSPFTYMTGVDGITDTMGNAIPEFGLTLHRLARARQWDEMNRIYHEAFDVLEIEMIYGRAGLREIGNMCGLNLGAPRHPMANVLSAKDRKDIRRRLMNWSCSQKLLAQPVLAGNDGST